MTGKQIRNYSGVLIALAALVLLIQNPFSSNSGAESIKPLFPKLDLDSIDRMRVVSDGSTTEITRRAPDDWTIGSDFPLPVDTLAINRAVRSLADLDTGGRVARNPDKHGLFEVDEKGVVVEMYAGGDSPVASFILGKNASRTSGTYYRLPDADDVYATSKPIKSFFVKPATSWRNRRIFNEQAKDFTSLTIERGDSTIVFEADADLTWSLKQPEEFPVKKEEVDRLLGGVVRLFANSLPDSAVSPEVSGIDEPTVRVRAAKIDGTGIELLIGKQDEGGLYYCKAGDREWLYQIAKYRVDPLYKDPTEMKAEEPPAPDDVEPGAEGDGADATDS